MSLIIKLQGGETVTYFGGIYESPEAQNLISELKKMGTNTKDDTEYDVDEDEDGDNEKIRTEKKIEDDVRKE